MKLLMSIEKESSSHLSGLARHTPESRLGESNKSEPKGSLWCWGSPRNYGDPELQGLLSPPARCWDYRCVLARLLYAVPVELWVSYMLGKHSTRWAMSPEPELKIWEPGRPMQLKPSETMASMWVTRNRILNRKAQWDQEGSAEPVLSENSKTPTKLTVNAL